MIHQVEEQSGHQSHSVQHDDISLWHNGATTGSPASKAIKLRTPEPLFPRHPFTHSATTKQAASPNLWPNWLHPIATFASGHSVGNFPLGDRAQVFDPKLASAHTVRRHSTLPSTMALTMPCHDPYMKMGRPPCFGISNTEPNQRRTSRSTNVVRPMRAFTTPATSRFGRSVANSFPR